jgi:uncharacterized protein YajQ (UPF0234 family)
MPSFDVVSETNLEEVENALQAMRREISQRYDFKDTRCSVERKEAELTVIADDDFKLNQMHELLRMHLTRRKVDVRVLDFKNPEKAAGQSLRQIITVKQGLDTETAKKIVKIIKDKKMKVNSSIRGQEVRVEGKKRDDLQEVMAVLRQECDEIPLQFMNFRD